MICTCRVAHCLMLGAMVTRAAGFGSRPFKAPAETPSPEKLCELIHWRPRVVYDSSTFPTRVHRIPISAARLQCRAAEAPRNNMTVGHCTRIPTWEVKRRTPGFDPSPHRCVRKTCSEQDNQPCTDIRHQSSQSLVKFPGLGLGGHRRRNAGAGV